MVQPVPLGATRPAIKRVLRAVNRMVAVAVPVAVGAVEAQVLRAVKPVLLVVSRAVAVRVPELCS